MPGKYSRLSGVMPVGVEAVTLQGDGFQLGMGGRDLGGGAALVASRQTFRPLRVSPWCPVTVLRIYLAAYILTGAIDRNFECWH